MLDLRARGLREARAQRRIARELREAAMELVRGIGAGEPSRRDGDAGGFPNLIRGSSVAGRALPLASGSCAEAWLCEVNLDDMTGEELAHAVHHLRESGAPDVWTTGVLVQQERPGVVLSAPCRAGACAAIEAALFEHTTFTEARSVQAALSSALTLTLGAALPVITAVAVPPALLLPLVATLSLCLLAGLGAAAARVGGAPVLRGALRVRFWGAAAMVATTLVGRLFGVLV